MVANLISEGRLLWLKPSDWTVLLASAVVCGLLTLII